MSETSKSETWKNVSRGTAVVYRYDRQGHIQDQSVRGGTVFTITTEERQYCQQRCRNEENDMFSNGMLQPVKLHDDAEDYESIANNPNFIEESEMKDLLELPVAKFRERIGQITNILAMERIVEMTEDEDNAVRKPNVSAAQARLEELKPKSKDDVGDDDDGGGFFDGAKVKPVSPSL